MKRNISEKWINAFAVLGIIVGVSVVYAILYFGVQWICRFIAYSAHIVK